MRLLASLALSSILGCGQGPHADLKVQGSGTVAARVAPTCGITGQLLLADSGIGHLRLGASVVEVRRECEVLADTVRVNDEFVEIERVLLVRLGRDTVAAAIDQDGRVGRIFVDRGSLRTADGVGIGTPLAELLDRQGIYGGVGESALHITVPPYCSLSFALSEAGVYEQGDNVDAAQLRRLPASTKVQRINIGPCAE